MNKNITVDVSFDDETINKAMKQIVYLKDEIQKLKTVTAELNSCISNLELQIDGRCV